MLRFLTLLVLILNTAAKFFSSIAYGEENGIQPQHIEPANFEVEFVNKGAPLWVKTHNGPLKHHLLPLKDKSLSGNDWMDPKLRLGNTAELEEFFNYIEPLIRKMARSSVRVKKDDPERSSSDDLIHRSIDDVKKDCMIIINKFALSSSIEPDAYIMDNTHSYDNSPSLTLHFKGPYSVVIVELGRKQWHYVINSPSSLPEWFHENHDTSESPILIPEDVKNQLFISLWRLLHVFFGYPV